MIPDATVLVVGAGPAGLMTALELALNGTAVTVIDARRDRGARSKATTIWSRQLELLDRHSLAERVAQTGARVERITVSTPRRRLGTFELAELRATRFPYGVSIPQPQFEAELRARLLEQGVTVTVDTELVEIENTGAGVHVALRDADGSVRELCVAFVVGADGPESTVRNALGIRLPQYGPDVTFAITDVAIEGPIPPRDVGYYYSDRGALGVVPVGAGTFRLATGIPDGTDTLGRQGFQDALAERAGITARLGELPWDSTFRVKFRHAETYADGRVALVGDAAHTMSPAGGQGMNTGLQDAVNLAWRVSEIVDRAAAPATLLEEYTRERQHDVRRVMQTSGLLTRFGATSTVTSRIERECLSAAVRFLPALRRRVTHRLVQLDTSYAQSHKIPGVSRLRPGDRLPDNLPTAPHHAHRTYRWTGAASAPNPDTRATDVHTLDATAVPADAAAVLGKAPAVISVRPDGHVTSITSVG